MFMFEWYLSGTYSVRRRLEREKLFKEVDTVGRMRVLWTEIMGVMRRVFGDSTVEIYDTFRDKMITNMLYNVEAGTKYGQLLGRDAFLQEQMMKLSNWDTIFSASRIGDVDGFDVAKKIILGQRIGTAEWKFNARTSFLVSDEFDVENVPAWEKQLHFGSYRPNFYLGY